MTLIDKLIFDCISGQGDSDRHKIVLFSLALNLHAKRILELGVRNGDSTLPLLLATAILPNSTLTSVDIADSGFRPPEQIAKNWNFIQTNSLEFLSRASGKFDLVFVDDWHGEDHVYKELCLLESLVDNSCLIVMHDTMHSFRHPNYNLDQHPQGSVFEGRGPYAGLLKFLSENNRHQNYEYSTLPTNHGLTILRKVR
jgi:predicted O-methyltransferase YrrM